MRGIEFQFNDGYGYILDKLLLNIPIENYDWYVYENEIIANGTNLCVPNILSSHELKKFIVQDSYYVYFLNLQAYPKGSQNNSIKTFEDFLNSSCEIVFLVNDGMYIEIYAKNHNLILQFIKNAEDIGSENIFIKTDKNDGRTKLSVC